LSDPVIDPVCGMRVDPEASAGRAEHGGTTYHFCGTGCRDKFVAAPERYLDEDASAGEAAGGVSCCGSGHDPSGGVTESAGAAGGAYTCPMHPEVRLGRDDACP
jgi:Cu+-exporting ATPase